MEHLTQRDFRALLECIRSCYVPSNFEDFVARTLCAVGALVPSEMSAFCEMNPQRRTSRNWLQPANFYPAAHDRVWPTVMHEHPVLSYNTRTGDGRPHKISDFVSAAKFKRTSLYNEFYRPVNLEDVLCFTIPSFRPRVLGFAFHRDRSNFTERERLLLNLLQPHLAQAWRNSRVFTRIEHELQLLRLGLEKSGVAIVILSPTGQVRIMNDCARCWLREFCWNTGTARKGLPEVVRDWICRQETWVCEAGIVNARGPLILEQERKRLVITIISTPSEKLLLLQRQESVSNVSRVNDCGLTARESDVLAWVAEGKTNQDIAAILGTSPRTVQKHLEHIFEKLGVDNRTAEVCQLFCVNGQVWFLGMGARGKGAISPSLAQRF
jgi:DNA-binding CsgD family transcriptional regulator